MSVTFDVGRTPPFNENGTFVHPDLLPFFVDEKMPPKWRELEQEGWNACLQWLDPNASPFDEPHLSPFVSHGLDSSNWRPAMDGWQLVGVWNGAAGIFACFVQPVGGFPKKAYPVGNWQLLSHIRLDGSVHEYPILDSDFQLTHQSSDVFQALSDGNWDDPAVWDKRVAREKIAKAEREFLAQFIQRLKEKG